MPSIKQLASMLAVPLVATASFADGTFSSSMAPPPPAASEPPPSTPPLPPCLSSDISAFPSLDVLGAVGGWGASQERKRVVQMTNCEPKTGTTATEWLVKEILKRGCALSSKDNATASGCYGHEASTCDFERRGRHYKLIAKSGGRESSATWINHGKHDGAIYFAWDAAKRANVGGALSRAPIQQVAARCVGAGLPAWSAECLLGDDYGGPMFDGFRKELGHRSGGRLLQPSPTLRLLTTQRDPISIAVSLAKYKGATPAQVESGESVGARQCAEAASRLAVRHYIATVAMPQAGYEVLVQQYSDLRLRPLATARRLATHLGVTLSDAALRDALDATSPDRMRAVQARVVDSGNGAKDGGFSGLSATGRNSRKVGDAEVRGYLTELPEASLAACMAEALFHLPPELFELYYGQDA